MALLPRISGKIIIELQYTYQIIRYNQKDATEADIIEATKAANAYDFITKNDFGIYILP